MRSLVSIYLFLRLLASLVTINQIPAKVSFSLLVFIYTASSTLIALTQPYKKKYMTIVDTLILANLATLSHILSQLLSGELTKPSVLFFYSIGSILAALPLLGLIGVTIYKMIRKLVNMQCCKRFLHSYQQLRNNDGIEDYDQDLALFASASCEDGDSEFQECTVSVKEQILL
jgi:phage-related holin